MRNSPSPNVGEGWGGEPSEDCFRLCAGFPHPDLPRFGGGDRGKAIERVFWNDSSFAR